MKLVISTLPKMPYWNLPRDAALALSQEFPGLEVVYLETLDDRARALVDADALCSYWIQPEEFHAARRLRWLHTTAASVERLLIPDVVASPVVVTNSRGANSPAVAEHVIAGLLALARKLPDAFRHQERRAWDTTSIWSYEPPLFELSGQTMGIIGLGSIGREVARRAAALGMRVLATRRDPSRGSDFVERVGAPEELPWLLAESDVVVVCAPLTRQSGTILGARELALMKPSALLINVSRGQVVDEPALVAALVARRMRGAVLDVFIEEPLPASSPLWALPHVIITSHYAGLSAQLWARVLSIFRENIRRFLIGEPLLNVVDKQRGY
jgi:phosphoglycerate dehydrogenase-like enzyme